MSIVLKDVIRKECNGRIFFTGWILASDIYDAVFVPVTKKTKLPKKAKKGFAEALEEKEGGYQRCASRSRQHTIGKYYKDQPTSIIPPVLLSDRGRWQWVGPEDGVGTLTITEKAAVVDGQHRLGGLRLQALMDDGDKSRRVPFVVVTGLEDTEEKHEFLTINNTQKGVPKAHTAFLESDKWWNAVGLELNESGPFEGRIQAAGGTREPWYLDLKLHSVANAIRQTFSPPKKPIGVDLWKFDNDQDRKDEIPDILNRYWELISEIFADEWSDLELLPYPEHLGGGGGENKTRDFSHKLLELTGFIVWTWFLRHIAVNVWNQTTKSLHEDELIKYLTWIREAQEPNPAYGKIDGEPEFRNVVDWRKKGKFAGRTGGAGARAMLDEMLRVVQERTGGD